MHPEIKELILPAVALCCVFPGIAALGLIRLRQRKKNKFFHTKVPVRRSLKFMTIDDAIELNRSGKDIHVDGDTHSAVGRFGKFLRLK